MSNEIPERCQWHKEAIDKVDRVLNGNGSEGLISAVNKIQTTNKLIIGLNIMIFVALVVALSGRLIIP